MFENLSFPMAFPCGKVWPLRVTFWDLHGLSPSSGFLPAIHRSTMIHLHIATHVVVADNVVVLVILPPNTIKAHQNINGNHPKTTVRSPLKSSKNMQKNHANFIQKQSTSRVLACKMPPFFAPFPSHISLESRFPP
jgi:hypothetical protein